MTSSRTFICIAGLPTGTGAITPGHPAQRSATRPHDPSTANATFLRRPNLRPSQHISGPIKYPRGPDASPHRQHTLQRCAAGLPTPHGDLPYFRTTRHRQPQHHKITITATKHLFKAFSPYQHKKNTNTQNPPARALKRAGEGLLRGVLPLRTPKKELRPIIWVTDHITITIHI